MMMIVSSMIGFGVILSTLGGTVAAQRLLQGTIINLPSRFIKSAICGTAGGSLGKVGEMFIGGMCGG